MPAESWTIMAIGDLAAAAIGFLLGGASVGIGIAVVGAFGGLAFYFRFREELRPLDGDASRPR